MAKEEEETYFMEKENPTELERLACQHETIKRFMGNLMLAPIDLSRPGLRILDSGTVDNKCFALKHVTANQGKFF